MAWVTWVTWVFVAIAAGVVVIAVLVSRGTIRSGFDRPYEPEEQPASDAAPRGAHRSPDGSGIEWSESAARRQHLDEDAVIHPQPHPRTTGEPADGRHEAQDR